MKKQAIAAGFIVAALATATIESSLFCDTCGELMKNMGNISGVVFTSNPPQWDDTYVCGPCKTKKTIRNHGVYISVQNFDEYIEQ